MKKFIAAVFLFSFFVALPVSAATTQELQAMIEQLNRQLQALQAAKTPTPGTIYPQTSVEANSNVSTYTNANLFKRNLYLGLAGDDVKYLQGYLYEAGYLKVAASGYFGGLTQAAVKQWQADNGLPVAGIFGSLSRAKYGQLIAANAGSHDDTGATPNPSPAPAPAPITSAPSATIDPASLTTSLVMPTLSGYAYNIVQPFGVSIGNSGGKIWGSGNVTVTNNRWSTTVNQSLAAGTYQVWVYSNNVLVTTGNLVITSPVSGQPLTLTSVLPADAIPGSRVTVYGSGFDYATTPIIDGNYGITIQPSAVTLGGSTQLSFILPTSLSSGNHSIQVVEKAGSALSNTINFTVGSNATITVTSALGDRGQQTIDNKRVFVNWSTKGIIGQIGIGFCPVGEAVTGPHCTMEASYPNTGSADIDLVGALSLYPGQWTAHVMDVYSRSVYGTSSSFTIAAAGPSLYVATPNGGEHFTTGVKDVDVINFSFNVMYTPKNLKAYLYSPTGSNIASRDLSNFAGAQTSSFPGSVVPASGQYKIIICDEGTDSPTTPGKPLCDSSDNYFSITTIATAAIDQATLRATPGYAFTITGNTSASNGVLTVAIVGPDFSGNSDWSRVGNILKGDATYAGVSRTVSASGSTWSAGFSGLNSEGYYTVLIYDGSYNLVGSGTLWLTYKG